MNKHFLLFVLFFIFLSISLNTSHVTHNEKATPLIVQEEIQNNTKINLLKEEKKELNITFVEIDLTQEEGWQITVLLADNETQRPIKGATVKLSIYQKINETLILLEEVSLEEVLLEGYEGYYSGYLSYDYLTSPDEYFFIITAEKEGYNTAELSFEVMISPVPPNVLLRWSLTSVSLGSLILIVVGIYYWLAKEYDFDLELVSRTIGIGPYRFLISLPGILSFFLVVLLLYFHSFTKDIYLWGPIVASLLYLAYYLQYIWIQYVRKQRRVQVISQPRSISLNRKIFITILIGAILFQFSYFTFKLYGLIFAFQVFAALLVILVQIVLALIEHYSEGTIVMLIGIVSALFVLTEFFLSSFSHGLIFPHASLSAVRTMALLLVFLIGVSIVVFDKIHTEIKFEDSPILSETKRITTLLEQMVDLMKNDRKRKDN